MSRVRLSAGLFLLASSLAYVLDLGVFLAEAANAKARFESSSGQMTIELQNLDDQRKDAERGQSRYQAVFDDVQAAPELLQQLEESREQATIMESQIRRADQGLATSQGVIRALRRARADILGFQLWDVRFLLSDYPGAVQLRQWPTLVDVVGRINNLVAQRNKLVVQLKQIDEDVHTYPEKAEELRATKQQLERELARVIQEIAQLQKRFDEIVDELEADAKAGLGKRDDLAKQKLAVEVQISLKMQKTKWLEERLRDITEIELSLEQLPRIASAVQAKIDGSNEDIQRLDRQSQEVRGAFVKELEGIQRDIRASCQRVLTNFWPSLLFFAAGAIGGALACSGLRGIQRGNYRRKKDADENDRWYDYFFQLVPLYGPFSPLTRNAKSLQLLTRVVFSLYGLLLLATPPVIACSS